MVVTFSACHSYVPPAGVAAPAAHSKSDATSLARLADEYWRAHLDADPIEATLLGTHGYDDRMPDESPEARDRNGRATSPCARVSIARCPKQLWAPPIG